MSDIKIIEKVFIDDNTLELFDGTKKTFKEFIDNPIIELTENLRLEIFNDLNYVLISHGNNDNTIRLPSSPNGEVVATKTLTSLERALITQLVKSQIENTSMKASLQNIEDKKQDLMDYFNSQKPKS